MMLAGGTRGTGQERFRDDEQTHFSGGALEVSELRFAVSFVRIELRELVSRCLSITDQHALTSAVDGNTATEFAM